MNTAAQTRVAPATLRHLFLMPEAHYCALEPAVVTTVLGSCVAICLYDRAQRFGGINHYLLPHGAGPVVSLRYGNMSIERLIGEMHDLGARLDKLEAKIFGGAAVLAVGTPADSVGTQNVRMAIDRLRRYRIRVTARRTGGSNGLLIRYSTGTGEVMVRMVEPGTHFRPVERVAPYDSHLDGLDGG
jgi:chemotaxis protein CheD